MIQIVSAEDNDKVINYSYPWLHVLDFNKLNPEKKTNRVSFAWSDDHSTGVFVHYLRERGSCTKSYMRKKNRKEISH